MGLFSGLLYGLKKHLIQVILPAIIICCGLVAQAQPLAVQNVEKIVIKHHAGGMGGAVVTSYEIQRQGEGWTSMRVHKSSNLLSYRTGKWENLDSAQRLPVTKFSNAAIGKLVEAINHPVKGFSTELMDITPQNLKAHADSLFKLVFHDPNAAQTAVFKNAITAERIDTALKQLNASLLMDAFDEYQLDIINKNGDTIKLTTRGFGLYKLPWKGVNGFAAYNSSISLFCNAAIHEQYTATLSGKDIARDVSEFIYENYCRDQVTTAYFKDAYKWAFEKLSKYYAVSGIRTSDILQAADPIVFMQLHVPDMAANININTALYIKHDGDVDRLTALRPKFEALAKTNNFLFKYVAGKSNYSLTIEDPNDSLSTYNSFQPQYPYLQNFPPAATMEIHIGNSASRNEFSIWALLPNGEVVLRYISGDKVLGFSRHDLNIQQQWPMETCIVFDQQGKIIHNFTR